MLIAFANFWKYFFFSSLSLCFSTDDTLADDALLLGFLSDDDLSDPL